MLTEEALNKMDAYAGYETARKLTLRDIVNQLTFEYRQLQQQNKQMKEALKQIITLDIDTFESDYYKMQEIAERVIKSIQGGSHDASDH